MKVSWFFVLNIILVLAIFALVFPANADILNVKAYIDGRSHLLIQGSNVWWHHYDHDAPGLPGDEQEPTILNSVEWYPEWPVEDPQSCDCDSSIYSELSPPLPTRTSAIDLRPISAIGEVSILQQPSQINSYTAIVEFNDNYPIGGLGAAWYEVDISYSSVCGDFNFDKDVDGDDLSDYISNSKEISLEDFAINFGRTDCA